MMIWLEQDYDDFKLVGAGWRSYIFLSTALAFLMLIVRALWGLLVRLYGTMPRSNS